MGSLIESHTGRMKYFWALLALAATSQAIECEECVSGMGMFPDALLGLSDQLNETLHHFGNCHPGAPCLIDDFIIDWLPAVLNEFVAGQAEAVCTNLGICSAPKEVSCHDCTKTLHNLANWLDSEEQMIEHVAFLQEGQCAGDDECAGNVEEYYSHYMRETCQNFIVAQATEQLCAPFCETPETTEAETTMGTETTIPPGTTDAPDTTMAPNAQTNDHTSHAHTSHAHTTHEHTTHEHGRPTTAAPDSTMAP